jgi:hypothetical protein
MPNQTAPITIEPGSRREILVDHFNQQKAKGQASVDKFLSEMKQNPGQALVWADKVFEETARLEVAGMVLYMLHNFGEIPQVIESLQSSARDRARYINNKSTSRCESLYKDCTLSQLTQALEHVELINGF